MPKLDSRQRVSMWQSHDCPGCTFAVPWSATSRPWEDFDCSIRFKKGNALQIIRLVVGNIIELQKRLDSSSTKMSVELVTFYCSEDGRKAECVMRKI